jgi:uncharacterized protein YecE (DUF72 family)
MGAVHVGTCAWTEKTMVDLWYPKGVTSPDSRLRYYASRFDTVEVDSPFYGIPPKAYAEAWAKRTPADFIFHVKAYGMMTQHEVDERSLPPSLRSFEHAVTRHGRVAYPHPDMVDAAFDIFLEAIDPLREAGKLGGILMQFPPYFTADTKEHEHRNLDYLEYVGGKLQGYRTLVEFRHPSWVRERARERTMRFLADRSMSYVSVDSPQYETGSTMPPLAALTGDWAYLRMHGRNRDTFFKRTGSSADRFDYRYSTEELEEWAPRIRSLAADADQTFVLFNNNKYDYAQRNAAEIATILADLVPERATKADGAVGHGSSETPSLF